MNPETPLTFADLGAPEDLVEYLAEDGITEPSPVQALTFAADCAHGARSSASSIRTRALANA